jgi:hypothetical protein
LKQFIIESKRSLSDQKLLGLYSNVLLLQKRSWNTSKSFGFVPRARALILAKRRDSDGADVLRSPDPAVAELEISWASGERDETSNGKPTFFRDRLLSFSY